MSTLSIETPSSPNKNHNKQNQTEEKQKEKKIVEEKEKEDEEEQEGEEDEEDEEDEEAQSEASTDSDLSPDSSEFNQDQTQYFTLHRHLDFHHENQNSLPLTGIDLFTSQIWELNQQQIKLFTQLNDTDLVQIHYPVPIKPQLPHKKITLADILPAQKQPSTTTTDHSRLTKTHSASSSGSSNFPSLYYSAYSSFAPCYDSTGTAQSIDRARLNYRSKRKIQDWSQRPNRYSNILNELSPIIHPYPTENVTEKKQTHPTGSTRAGPGRRKRQKTSSSLPASTSSNSSIKDPSPLTTESTTTTAGVAPVETPEQIRQTIYSTLIETSTLIQNLQERQFDRLGLCQKEEQAGHLDPLLSTPSSSSIFLSKRDHSSFSGKMPVLEPGQEELEEAHQLIHRLSTVIARRPRPDPITPVDHPDSSLETQQDDHNAPQTVIPSLDSIRRSYATIVTQSSSESNSQDENLNSNYQGQLPANNPVGIAESTLVSQPDPALISILEKSSTGHAGRMGAGTSTSTLNTPARRGPNLSTPRGGTGIVNFNHIDLTGSIHKTKFNHNQMMRYLPPNSSPIPIPPVATPTLLPNTNTRLMSSNNSSKYINVGSYNGNAGLNHYVGFGHPDSPLIRDNNLHVNLDSHPNYKALASHSAASYTR